MAGVSEFTRAGYPTIATVGGTLIFLYTIYYSATKTGYGGWRNHGVWFFFNLWLWLFGLFLVFGPDSLAAASAGTASLQTLAGPRAAIIGLQLMVQAAVGAFAIYSANAYASLVFALIGLFNELCLIGSNFFFNYNQPIWTLNEPQCNAYFDLDCGTVGTCSTFTRCKDDGYLEVLRVFGTLEIILNGFLIVIALLAYATAVPVGHPGYPVGAPGATGVPAAGVPAAYNAGPAYSREQQYTTAGAPVTSTTQYTTTTGVPATTTTTTM